MPLLRLCADWEWSVQNLVKATSSGSVLLPMGQTNTPMQHATSTQAPRSVANAIRLIWLTIAANALLMAVNYDDTGNEAVVFNTLLLVVNGCVASQIAGGKNWARMAYSVLVAMDLALILAFGLDGASDLEAVVAGLTMAMEGWILFRLFDAKADHWFKSTGPA